MTVYIVGAGMAGLLAANLLQRHRPQVFESQSTLPNNHHAVLRFRSPIVGEVLGIPFKRVTVRKAHVPWRNPVADALAYAKKNGGTYRTDRSIGPPETVERWVAPPDLINRMAEMLPHGSITFDSEVDIAGLRRSEPGATVISTMPMPNLMNQLRYPSELIPEFQYVHGAVLKFRVRHCDAYASLYVPDPSLSFSRVSVTGDEVIVEFPMRKEAEVDRESHKVLQACDLLGIDSANVDGLTIEVRGQRYAKIMPVDETKRRNFLHWCSTINGYAYSLGRFATWRPGLLLDDLVQDVRRIETWMTDPSSGYLRDVHLAEKRSAA
jgi:hypothetical protein